MEKQGEVVGGNDESYVSSFLMHHQKYVIDASWKKVVVSNAQKSRDKSDNSK